MARPWLLFDYDDTLGGVLLKNEVRPTYSAYDDVLEQFGREMERAGFDKTVALTTQNRIDSEAATRLGFADKTRFATSMVDTYTTLSEKPVDPDFSRKLYALGMSVFTAYPYRPLAGALDVLKAVRKQYRIAVVTKGEEKEQRRKVRESRVCEFAILTIVLSHKNAEEWERVVRYTLGMTDDLIAQSWAIGNSLKSDVNPLLPLGFNGIYISGHDGWDFEKAEAVTPLEGRVVHSVAAITDVPNLVLTPR